jgi:hypothetical protein
MKQTKKLYKNENRCIGCQLLYGTDKKKDSGYCWACHKQGVPYGITELQLENIKKWLKENED